MDRFHIPAPTTSAIHFKAAAGLSKWLAEDRQHPAIANLGYKTITKQIVFHLREFLCHSASEVPKYARP